MGWGACARSVAASLVLVAAQGGASAESRLPQFVAPGTWSGGGAVAWGTATQTIVEPSTVRPRGEPQVSWPRTVEEARAEDEARRNPKPEQWSAGDVAEAKARCDAILKQIAAVAVPEPPMKRGACGTPAPIRLVSIGRNPEIALSPPALVTCEFARAMHTWVQTGLQPLARKHLGAPVVRIEVMSDYACRNAYGRAKTRLSEHGRANALDIRSFVTAKSESATLLDHWGPTERDIRAQIAAANAAAAKRAAAQSPAPPTAAPTPPSAVPMEAIATARGTIADGLGAITSALPDTGQTSRPSLALDGASRLGGPKQAALSADAPRLGASVSPQTAKARFLREAHTSACGVFGTVLGPEANNAHRNHFHVDAAKRNSGSFCQ